MIIFSKAQWTRRGDGNETKPAAPALRLQERELGRHVLYERPDAALEVGCVDWKEIR